MWSDLARWLKDQLSTQVSEGESGDGVSELTFGK
jgi:hypothetical protein